MREKKKLPNLAFIVIPVHLVLPLAPAVSRRPQPQSLDSLTGSQPPDYRRPARHPFCCCHK